MDAKLVGGLLGHADRRSTDRYTHIFAARLREKANAAQQSVAKAGKAGTKKALAKLAKD
jgi:site-specific recombinase XerD